MPPGGSGPSAVTNFAVLNNILDLRRLFDNWVAVMDPAGLAIVSVLNIHFWKEFAHVSKMMSRRPGRRASQSDENMDTYLHTVREISSAAAPRFVPAFQASAAFLIRYGAGVRDWWKPRSAAERIEHHLWRTPPLSGLGKFLFIGFRRVP